MDGEAMKILIVGGVAGGASAAARARRLSEDAEIVVFERGNDVSFANCGLPYYVGETIPKRQSLLVTTPERLRTRFRIDVRVRSTVTRIDRVAKTVHVRETDGGLEYDEPYDVLLLAPGAAPLKPPVPGIDSPRVLTLRNLDDVDRIKGLVDAAVAKTGGRVVVVGAGFIGLELAENLVHRKLETTVVELQQQVLPPLDPEMTPPIVQALRSRGVRVLLGDSAAGFEERPGRVGVRLTSGELLEADLVILGVGVRPESRLASDAGLAVGPRGGIRVTASMQTSDPAIYAVGDAIEVVDVVTGAASQVPLAGPANRQGRIAADAIFGRATVYRGTQGTAIVGVFDSVAAITGASEKVLRREGRAYRKVYVHPASHAGYYPGAEPMALKVIFCPESGRILGAQAVGGAGVDKRIDVIAVAIQAGMSVYDLEEMELTYAPQFGSAKDPVNMAGFVAAGMLRGDHPQADFEEILAWEYPGGPPAGSILLDVRTPEEFVQGHVPGARNIPVDELRGRLGEIPVDARIFCYCQVGQRGYLATRILLQRGFTAVNLGGGFKTYRLHRP